MPTKLIIALDVPTADEARRVVAQLRGSTPMFKIGSQLFTAAGPSLVREIVQQGSEVFLDLKFHDIPQTVLLASREAVRLGVSIFNVHALGGIEMMRRAADVTHEIAAKEGLPRPKAIAVTILTSHTAMTLAEIGVEATVENQVVRLARLAAASGLDGVVASAHEIGIIRKSIENRDFTIVTPGIRPASSAHDDQKRVMTPAEAVRAGADYIVVGRAVLNAPDPELAVAEINQEMQRAFTESQ